MYRLFTLLKQRYFLKFWTAQIFTQLGDGLIRTVIIYLIAATTNDPLMVGLVIFAQMLPVAVFGVFMGSLPDRFSKRWLLVISNIYQLLVVIGMWFVQDSALLLLGMMLVYGFGIGLYEPTRSASIPSIVKQEDIPKAVGLSQGSTQAMMLIGPAVAGLLFFAGNYLIIFSLISITYIVATLLLFNFSFLDETAADKDSDSGESYLASIGNGVKQVFSMPALRFLLIILIPITLAAGVLNTNINTLYLQTFDVPAEQYGFLLAVFGGGAIIGALIAPALLKKTRPGYMMMVGVGLLGCSMIAILLVSSLEVQVGFLALYLWSVFTGIFNTTLNVPISALFLQTTPASFLGRGASLMQASVNLGTMAGILLGGWFAGWIGSLYTTASVGVFLLLTIMMIPLFKGFRYLNQEAQSEGPSEQVNAIEGVLGRVITIRRNVTDLNVMQTLLQKRMNRMLALLATQTLTVEQLSNRLHTPTSLLSEDLQMLEQNQLVKKVEETEDYHGAEPMYTLNKERTVEFNLDRSLTSYNQSVVMNGVNNFINPGLHMLEKQLNSPQDEPGYKVMLSSYTGRVTADQWRSTHQEMMKKVDGHLNKDEGEGESEAFPLTSDESQQEGTYVFVLMSYRLEDSEKLNADSSKELESDFDTFDRGTAMDK